MANRHKVQKTGIDNGTAVSYGNPKVIKEAKERKRGGRAEHKLEGEKAMKRMDKRARGGRTNGGGADKHPFSSAGSGMRDWNPGKGG